MIEVSYLNDNCALNISDSREQKKVQVCIDKALLTLKGVICDGLYDQIASESVYGDWTGKNEVLYESHIAPFLAWTAYSYYIPFSQVASTDAGFREYSEENSTPANPEQLKNLEKFADNTAKQYEASMLAFMYDNEDDFSLYFDSECYNCWKKKNRTGIKVTGAGTRKIEFPDKTYQGRWR